MSLRFSRYGRWLAALAAISLLTGIGAGISTAAEAPPKKQTAPARKKTPAPAKAAPGAKAKKAAAPAGAKSAISKNPYLGVIAVDAATGRVLAEDQPDARAYPASVLKLMDLLLVLERIEARQLTLADNVTVSAKASKTGGSQVWLAEKEVFTVEELLYALMIQSANDSAVALAEKVAGSTDAFVELMNKRAKELGMNQTVFRSVHGLPPSAGQQPDVTTPRDFAILCRELVRRPEVLKYTSARERPFRPNGGEKRVVMRTHNHLLGSVDGCDGLKTGFYSVAGYSIAATASRNGQRVIVVVLGSTDRKVRDAKAAEWIAKGFTALSGAGGTATPAPAAGR